MGEFLHVGGVRIQQVAGRLIVNGREVKVHADKGDRSITITTGVHKPSFIAGLKAAAAVSAVPVLASTENPPGPASRARSRP
jgi:hypothetical protein